jgi:hypothetical protein
VYALAAVTLVAACGSAPLTVQPGAPVDSASTDPTVSLTVPSTSSTSTTSTTSPPPQSGVRWVAITDVSARVDLPTVLHVGLDVCADVAPPRVVESATEVRLIFDTEHDYSGMQLMCQTVSTVQLQQPIGGRKVIDDHHGRSFEVAMQDPPAPPAKLTGGVRDVLGKEGDATVTAWLLIDQAGAAAFCDDLPASALSCPTPTLAVDWATGGATPPTDLVQRGPVRVSAAPITLRGSLKSDTLFVGVVP